jgi:hypothetical protein
MPFFTARVGYESEGRTFESFRARHFLRKITDLSVGVMRCALLHFMNEA